MRWLTKKPAGAAVEESAAPIEAVLVRRYPHPVTRVFRAWSIPRHIERWLRPHPECRLRVAMFDFREGGDFLFEYEWGDKASPVRGRFLTILPGKALVYSWMPLPPDPYAGRETVVSVRFTPVAAGTEVVVRHAVFPNDEMRDRHRTGWDAALGLLADHLVSEPLQADFP